MESNVSPATEPPQPWTRDRVLAELGKLMDLGDAPIIKAKLEVLLTIREMTSSELPASAPTTQDPLALAYEEAQRKKSQEAA